MLYPLSYEGIKLSLPDLAAIPRAATASIDSQT